MVLPALGAHPEVLVDAEPGDELHVERVHHVTRALAVCDVDGSVGNGGQVPTRDINLTCPRGIIAVTTDRGGLPGGGG